MSLPTPSYTFVTSGGQRQFFHRWQFENNEVIECNKCGTTCKQTDAYSQHWQRSKTHEQKMLKTIDEEDELNTWTTTATTAWMRTTLMEHKQVIVNNNVESFMLCAGKVESDTQQFLLDAGIQAIPHLLRALFALDSCNELIVKLRFYVEITNEMFMLQTSELEIKHFHDIRESVDMIFLMLLEKLRTFMTGLPNKCCGMEKQYNIKRMHIKVKRIPRRYEGVITLPLQFKRKHVVAKETETKQHYKTSTTTNSLKDEDILKITSSFRQYLDNKPAGAAINLPLPCNLYCFRVCPNSQELYAVPYHLHNASGSYLNTRSFIILNDILGNFLQLQEISNIKRFLHHSIEDQVLVCPFCKSKFMQHNEFAIHKMLNCGYDFEVIKIAPDSIELYERCFEMFKCAEGSLYGIIE